MPRYFIEVAYLGTAYAGFQKQDNANTIQSEIEKVLFTYFRSQINLTGSSRTDAGVHALQNYFHFDVPELLNPDCIYNLNAILPASIVIKSIFNTPDSAHARFGAIAREYAYTLILKKDPYLYDRAYFYPYILDVPLLQKAATILMEYEDFGTFSKKGSQVKTTICKLYQSQWIVNDNQLIYQVKGNRFLRGMVRGLVGTMLQVGRNKIDLNTFRKIIESKDVAKANFAVPGHGLTLVNVHFPPLYSI